MFGRGQKVGILAWELFPGGVDARASKRIYPLADVAKTKTLINNGTTILFEPAFQYEGVLVYADILISDGEKWTIIEVKSSARVNNANITDAALQYYVIKNSGLLVKDIRIMHIDTSYLRKEKLDLRRLFKSVSIKSEVLSRQQEMREKISVQTQSLLSGLIPQIIPGEHCFKPYHCDFQSACKVIHPPKTKSTEKINIQVKQVKDFYTNVKYPLYFMDFEMFMPAIPIFKDTSPFQGVPFQYSIIKQVGKGLAPEIFNFLAYAGGDPRVEFSKSLISILKDSGSILTYDGTAEREMLSDLASAFPEFIEPLKKINLRIIDLMELFKKKTIIIPDIGDSYSLKKVFFNLTGSDGYQNLKIRDGFAAMNIYESMIEETDIFEIQRKREELIEYCQMDSYAIMKVFEKVESMII